MDARDRSDAIVLTYETAEGYGRGDTRRVVFEPLSDPPDWMRTEMVCDGDGWREIGGEYIERVDVEVPSDE